MLCSVMSSALTCLRALTESDRNILRCLQVLAHWRAEGIQQCLHQASIWRQRAGHQRQEGGSSAVPVRHWVL